MERPASGVGASLPWTSPPQSQPSERRQHTRPHLIHHVLQLQRQHGNRYVQRVLTRPPRGSEPNAGPGHGAAGDLTEQHGAAEEAAEGARPISSAAMHRREAPRSSAPALNVARPAVQRAWYNFHIPFTNYEFDPSLEGVKTAAGVAKDTVVDAAGWVKDKAVAGFEWLVKKVEQLISSGVSWLTDKLTEAQEFAVSSFDAVRDGLSGLLERITSPVSAITAAFTSMDPELLASAWNTLATGASFVWTGIKTLIDQTLSAGTTLWETASGYVTDLFDNVNSVLDSWPFRQLPDSIQNGARSLFGDLRSLWDNVRGFISDTLKRLRSFTDAILAAIESFVRQITSYAIQKVIGAVRAIKAAWEFVKKIADDPEGFIRPTIEQLTAKLNAEAPPKAIELGREKLLEAVGHAPAAPAGAAVVQRQPAVAKPERSTASSEEVDAGISQAIGTAWAGLNIGEMLWDSIVTMFWPPATIRAIGREFSELWNNDWATAASNFFAPRSILEDPLGFFHDVWSNLLVALDFPLALWRRLNNVLMNLVGYLTIVLVIVGAVGGGIAGAAAGGVGAIPGAIAGAMAGLELAGAIGLALVASYFAAESITVIKLIVELRTARQTRAEQARDYTQVAASLLGMAVAAVLVAIIWLLSELLSAVVRAVKGGGRAPAGGGEAKPQSGGARPAEGQPTPEPKTPGETKLPPSEDVGPPGTEPPKTETPVEKPEAPPETPAARTDQLIICRVCDIVPGVPPEILAERAALSPEMRAFLDSRAAKFFPDPASPTPEGFKALKGFIENAKKKGGGDLEAGLKKMAPQPKPTGSPRGSAVRELPRLRQSLQEAIKEIEAFAVDNPSKESIANSAQRLREVVDGPLADMENGRLEATPEQVQGIDRAIKGARGELQGAETAPAQTRFGDLVDGVEIDQIRPDGTYWQRKSIRAVRKPSRTFDDTVAQIKRTLTVAQNNPIGGVPRKVVFEFPEGLAREIAAEFRAIEVNGQKPTIIADEIVVPPK